MGKKLNAVKVFALMDMSTGEIVSTKKVRKKCSVDIRVKSWYENGFDMGKGAFVKIWTEEYLELIKELSACQLQLLAVLFPFVSYHDNILKYGNKPVKYSKILHLTGVMSEPAFYKYIKELEELLILVKRDGKVYMNPLICCRGGKIDEELLKLFKNYPIRSCDCKPWWMVLEDKTKEEKGDEGQ